MSKSFTLRLPEHIADWIDSESRRKGLSKSLFVVDALTKMKESKGDSDVLQEQGNLLTPVRQAQDDLLTPVRQMPDNLQDSILQLTKAVEAATTQLSQLTLPKTKTKPVQKTKTTKPDKPMPKTKAKEAKKAKSKTTSKGGAPAPLYQYKGLEGTLREHIVAALDQISDKDIRLTTRMINKRIKAGEGNNKAIEAAIAHRKTALKS